MTPLPTFAEQRDERRAHVSVLRRLVRVQRVVGSPDPEMVQDVRIEDIEARLAVVEERVGALVTEYLAEEELLK